MYRYCGSFYKINFDANLATADRYYFFLFFFYPTPVDNYFKLVYALVAVVWYGA